MKVQVRKVSRKLVEIMSPLENSLFNVSVDQISRLYVAVYSEKPDIKPDKCTKMA